MIVLRVAGYGLRVHGLRVIVLRIAGYELRVSVTSYGLKGVNSFSLTEIQPTLY